MDMKQLGGMLLVAGNAIGGGMLALPLATASLGFFPAMLFLITCWALMLAGGLLMLEVNLRFPAGCHLLSMAHATLGRMGMALTGLCYLLLLYALLAAYIAGGADFLYVWLHNTLALPCSLKLTAMIFVLIFGGIIYRGIHSVDRLNRWFMGGKLLLYGLLVSLLMPFVTTSYLRPGHFQLLPPGLTIMVTSFGFAAIVPSLRNYFAGDHRLLRRVIIVGSLIPLLCYILWNAAIMGIIPGQGPLGLSQLAQPAQPASALTDQLSHVLQRPLISRLAWGFSSICLATSFLGVGLSLTDFLTDGLRLAGLKKTKSSVAVLSFLPPLVTVWFFPSAFMKALYYAGIFCATLLVLLPALMAYASRYYQPRPGPYQMAGGQWLLSLLIVASAIIIVNAI